MEYAPFLIFIRPSVRVLAEQVLEAPLLSSQPYSRKEIIHVTPPLYLLLNSFAEKVLVSINSNQHCRQFLSCRQVLRELQQKKPSRFQGPKSVKQYRGKGRCVSRSEIQNASGLSSGCNQPLILLYSGKHFICICCSPPKLSDSLQLDVSYQM